VASIYRVAQTPEQLERQDNRPETSRLAKRYADIIRKENELFRKIISEEVELMEGDAKRHPPDITTDKR